MERILVVGGANVDFVVAADRLPAPGETRLGGEFATFAGGKGANQAVAAARAGGAAAFLGCVGRDDLGARLRAGLESEGVDVAHLMEADGPSGVALIVTAPAGDNMIVVAPGANAALTAERIDEAAFEGAGFVLAQLETPLDGALHAARLTRVRGARFILDPAPAATLPPDLLPLVDWLTPNEGEARVLLGLGDAPMDPRAAATRLQAMGPRGVVLTLGSQGVVLLEPGGEPCALPAPEVEVVDTTAAGDAFNGAFATALAEGATPREAAGFALAASALAVTRRGAQPSMAAREQIDAFRAGRP